MMQSNVLKAKQLFDTLDVSTMSPDERALHDQLAQRLAAQPAVRAATRLPRMQRESDAAEAGVRNDTVSGGLKDAAAGAVFGMPADVIAKSLDFDDEHPVASVLIPGGPIVGGAAQSLVPPILRSARNQITQVPGEIRQAAAAYSRGKIAEGVGHSLRAPARAAAAGLAPFGVAAAADAFDELPAADSPRRAAGNAIGNAVMSTAAATGGLSPRRPTAPAAPSRVRTAVTARFPERLVGSIAKSDERAGARAVMARRIGTNGDPGNLPTENFAKNVGDAWNEAGADVQRVIDAHSAANPDTLIDVSDVVQSPYEKRIAEVSKFARGDKTAVSQIESLTDQAERRASAAAEYAGLRPGVDWQPGDPIPMTPSQIHQFTRDWRQSTTGGFDRMEPTEQAVVLNLHDIVKDAVPGAREAMQDYHDLSRYNEALQEHAKGIQGNEITPPLVHTIRGTITRKIASGAAWKLPLAYGLNEFAPEGYRYVGTHRPAAVPAADAATLAGGAAGRPMPKAATPTAPKRVTAQVVSRAPAALESAPPRTALPAASKATLRSAEAVARQTAADVESTRQYRVRGPVEAGGAVEPKRVFYQPGRMSRKASEAATEAFRYKRGFGTPTADFGVPSAPKTVEAKPQAAPSTSASVAVPKVVRAPLNTTARIAANRQRVLEANEIARTAAPEERNMTIEEIRKRRAAASAPSVEAPKVRAPLPTRSGASISQTVRVPSNPLESAASKSTPVPRRMTAAEAAAAPKPALVSASTTTIEAVRKAAPPAAKRKLTKDSNVTHSIQKPDGSTLHVVEGANTESGRTVVVEPPTPSPTPPAKGKSGK